MTTPEGAFMVQAIDTDDYLALLLNDTPLMDVRAPVEYQKGALPTAINIPLLDDNQRQVIGTEYKQQGQDAAIELGYELATDEIRSSRLEAWKQFAEAHPNGFLYCFRGGLRSRITQQWLNDIGIQYPFVRGGYKAMRRAVIDALEHRVSEQTWLCLSGSTGSGKTRVLPLLKSYLDLEKIAHHRGSAFGRTGIEQPNQINFEFELARALLALADNEVLVVEDEAKLIGSRSIPPLMHEAMQSSDIVILQQPLESRVRFILEDYVIYHWDRFKGLPEGDQIFSTYVLDNLHRIRRRLGSERYQAMRQDMIAAIDQLIRCNQLDGFFGPIEMLLTQYYDPMYDYQISRRSDQIIFRGGQAEVVEFCQSYQANHTP